MHPQSRITATTHRQCIHNPESLPQHTRPRHRITNTPPIAKHCVVMFQPKPDPSWCSRGALSTTVSRPADRQEEEWYLIQCTLPDCNAPCLFFQRCYQSSPTPEAYYHCLIPFPSPEPPDPHVRVHLCQSRTNCYRWLGNRAATAVPPIPQREYSLKCR